MAEVTVYDATRMKAIEDNTVVNGEIDPVTGHLMLTRFNTTEIDAGLVLTSPRVVTSGTRPTGGALFDGLVIYETDTDRFYVYNGTAWIPQGQGAVICTSGTRPAAPFDGLHIYETDTKRRYSYDGTAWRWQSGGTDPVSAKAHHDNSGYNTTGSPTPDILRLNVEDWDYGNNFNPATYKYTAPEAFNARVSARISIIGLTGDRFSIGAFVNNAEVARGTDFYCQAGQRLSLELATTVHLNATEVLDFRINQYTGAGRTIDVGGGGELFYGTITRD